MKARFDLRAALAWAEALTRLPGGEAPDAAYEQACRHFSVAQVAELSLAVAEIDAIIDEALACHVGFLDAGAPLQTNVRSLRCERTFGGFMPPASHDSDYLGRLQDYFAAHRSLPSFSHMARLLGLRSVASAHAVAGRLKLAGFLQTTPDRRLAPGPRFFDRPVADSVRAGLPAAANDAGTETLTIDEFLVDSPSRTILLTVKGDSMIEAGLQPGDYIVVEKGRSARVGDIVVAIVDNEFTLKYLAQDKRGVYLKAGNPAYPPIRPQGQLEIFGLVTGSFRKYA